MGLFDWVTITDGHSECDLMRESKMQTKSLYRGLGRFRIKVLRLEENIMDAWIEQDFHGDLLLTQTETEGHKQYVARFTEGELQWIRRVEECPEPLVNRLGEE